MQTNKRIMSTMFHVNEILVRKDALGSGEPCGCWERRIGSVYSTQEKAVAAMEHYIHAVRDTDDGEDAELRMATAQTHYLAGYVIHECEVDTGNETLERPDVMRWSFTPNGDSVAMACTKLFSDLSKRLQDRTQFCVDEYVIVHRNNTDTARIGKVVRKPQTTSDCCEYAMQPFDDLYIVMYCDGTHDMVSAASIFRCMPECVLSFRIDS